MFYPFKHDVHVPILESEYMTNYGRGPEGVKDEARGRRRPGGKRRTGRGSVEKTRRCGMHGSSQGSVEGQLRAHLARLLNAARHPLALMLAIIGMAKGARDASQVLECTGDHVGRE